MTSLAMEVGLGSSIDFLEAVRIDVHVRLADNLAERRAAQAIGGIIDDGPVDARAVENLRKMVAMICNTGGVGRARALGARARSHDE